MVRTDKIRGMMAEQRISGRAMAKELGITPKGFYDKMKHGRFGTDEALVMTEVLHIQNPVEIFFAKE